MTPKRDYTWLIAIVGLIAGLLIGLWAGARWAPSLVGVSYNNLSPQQQDDYATLVALGYSQTKDLEQAKAQLQALKAPNLGQLVSGVAERRISSNGRPEEITALAQLAIALGVLSPALEQHLPTPTPLPTPTAIALAPSPVPVTVAPTAPPSAGTPTPAPASDTPTPATTPTPEPPTATPEPAPAMIAVGDVNVRSGPGLDYEVVATLSAGDKAPITGIDKSGQWWQVKLTDGAEAWVLGQLVSTEGPVEGSPIIEDIPLPPATPTRPLPANTPVRPTPAPTQAPAAGWTVDVRLRPVGQDAQHCHGGEHNIFVTVVDANGSPINGQRVREVYTGQVQVTGDQGKGDGRVEYDIYRGGGGVVELVDGANNAISPQSRGMSADWPDFDLMLAAGYCNCKPHPDPASCEADLNNKTYLFAVGHYVYDVTFRRNF